MFARHALDYHCIVASGFETTCSAISLHIKKIWHTAPVVFLTYKVLNGAALWHLEPLIRLADMRGWRKLRSTKLLSIWWTAACVHPTSQAVIALDRPTSPVDGATTPSQHVWSSGFLRCGSDGMKLASTLTLEPCSETGGFRSALKTNLSALERDE